MSLPNGWKKVKLGDVVKMSSGGTPSKDNASFWDGDIPWISALEMHKNFVEDAKLNITEEALKKGSSLAKKNDLLLLTRGSMLWKRIPVCLCLRNVAFNQDVKCLHANEKLNSTFLLYWFGCMEPKIMHMVVGTGIGAGKLESSGILNLDVNLPPLEEQKKIAATLSVWDSAIEKMEKLIEAKEISFNSLLKELIYAPAEKECWNIVKLGDVSEMCSGGTPKSSVETYYNGDVLWVSIADMTEQGMYIKDTAKKLTKLGVENSAAKIYPKGTVLYAMYASIGEVSIAEKEMASSQAILGIQVSDKLVNKYLYYFLVGQKERIKLQGQAGTQSNLNAGMVKNLNIPLPSIKIQNKIIAVLDNGMNELSLLKQQLENYKKQKQGLMQKLLTGQWRVK
jgi:Restriction endonuclease S subunits